MSKFSFVICAAGVIFFGPHSAVAQEESPLCRDLGRLACAPGSFKDGTGEVKSDVQASREILAFVDKSREDLKRQFSKILDDPKNAYFKDTAVAALGLKGAPACNSERTEDRESCRQNAIEGLAGVAQTYAVGAFVPKLPGATRLGDLKDLAYVSQAPVFQEIVRELTENAGKKFGNPDITQKIEKRIFPSIKTLIRERIGKMTVPDATKKMMQSKVDAITFNGSNCDMINSRGGPNSNGVASLLTPNAFYDPLTNGFNLCAGLLLKSTSEFTIATVIAHEIAHSIDPCMISMGPKDLAVRYSNTSDLAKMEGEYPIKNLIPCLRSEKSIGAKNMEKVGTPGAKLSFCNHDQIGECVADWMAAEVVPSYIERNHKLSVDQYRVGYANALRPICDSEAPHAMGARGSHPEVGDRINKVLLANPKVRAQMGCPPVNPDAIYCDPETPFAVPTPAAPAGMPISPYPGYPMPGFPVQGVPQYPSYPPAEGVQ